MIQPLFNLVANILQTTANLLKITYNEINIIVYYLLIPLSWCVMADVCLQFPICTPLLLGIWGVIIIKTWGRFSAWCDWAFHRSVDFLYYFNRWGGNYVLNSVIICVVIPLLIYALLLVLLLHSL